MSISLPSKEIYVVDVPEVDGFQGSFQYNFFTPDESVSATGGVTARILKKEPDEIDAAFIQYATTRVPRYTTLSWKLSRLVGAGKQVTDLNQRNNVFATNSQNGSLIADNINRVVTEDNFSVNSYVAATFHDGEIDDKVYHFVSGSYVLHMLGEGHDSDVSHLKAAHVLSSLTPKHIKPHFLFRALANPSRAYGTRYFSKDGKRVFNSYFRRLKDVAVNVQVNAKLFHDITNRTIKDPQSPFTSDLQNMHKLTKKLKHKSMHKTSLQVSELDFKTFVPFVDMKVRHSSNHDQRDPEIVGYIIDKAELLRDGRVQQHDPIIIDNPNVHFTADFQVKYGSTYVYTIRTVALFNVPAIDDDSGDIAMLKVLLSSKPSNKLYIKTIETTAPPSPADVNFTWDYERVNPTTAQYDQSGNIVPGTGVPGSLLVHWTFPPNSQRDIKKFQVFRRASVDHPFELVKMYDFDDSVIRYPNSESPNPSLVEHLASPNTFFYDDDFYVGDHNNHDPHGNALVGGDRHPGSSTFIYAIASVDAHGYTSNYSAQFEVWFDQYKNKLEKKLISHSGAPKPYPNLYLEADTFVDTIRVSGPHSKRLKVYFNPEFYHLYDDHERLVRLLATKQTGGSYKLQFINMDNQKSVSADILINDQVRAATQVLAFPEVRFGPRRRSQTRKIINH